jgi:hypothetical protein
LNNASRSFAYFVIVTNQFTGDPAQYLVFVCIVAFLYYKKELDVIPEFLSGMNKSRDGERGAVSPHLWKLREIN